MYFLKIKENSYSCFPQMQESIFPKDMGFILLYSFNLHGDIPTYRRNKVHTLPSVTKKRILPLRSQDGLSSLPAP